MKLCNTTSKFRKEWISSTRKFVKVIRQLVDPYFDYEVRELYFRYRHQFRFARDGGVWKHCYAAFNRDEFLAECLCVASGLKTNDPVYVRSKMATLEAMSIKCAPVLELLDRHFLLPAWSR